MKKMCSFLLALLMCASLAACGGGGDKTPDDGGSATAAQSPDGAPTDAQLQALTEAYNQVAVLYNDVVTKAQENGWIADAETNDTIQTISAVLDPVGEALSGDLSALNGADFDQLPDTLLELVPTLETLAEKVANPYEDGGVAVTDETLKPLATAYNELVPTFNEVYETAEANGWLSDATTSEELDAAYALITYVGSGLTDDPSKLEDTDLDALVEQLQQFGSALEEIGERVSVPYEG